MCNRTDAPRLIGRFDRDRQGRDILVPDGDGVPIVIHQWIDKRPPEEKIQAILAEIAQDYSEWKSGLEAVRFS